MLFGVFVEFVSGEDVDFVKVEEYFVKLFQFDDLDDLWCLVMEMFFLEDEKIVCCIEDFWDWIEQVVWEVC